MGRILSLMLLLLVSCVSLSRMNRNMEMTNDLMIENIEMVRDSIVSVDANTEEIHRSTQAMYLLPFVGIVFLLVLFTPIFLLFRMYKQLAREISRKDR